MLSQVHDALVIVLVLLTVDHSHPLRLDRVPHYDPALQQSSQSVLSWSEYLLHLVMLVPSPHHGGQVVVLTSQHLVTVQTRLVLGVTVVAVPSVHHSAGHLKLDLVLFDAVNLETNKRSALSSSVEMLLTLLRWLYRLF